MAARPAIEPSAVQVFAFYLTATLYFKIYVNIPDESPLVKSGEMVLPGDIR